MPFCLLISFHGIGHEFEGVLASSALVFRCIPEEGSRWQVVDLHPAMTQLFQFNNIEPLSSTRERFAAWLEEAETLAMAEWHRSLTR